MSDSHKARNGRRSAPERDQEPSIFTTILERLVAATPGAVGTALVDYEGETVDYAGYLEAFDLKVTAAHWQIVLAETAEAEKIGPIRQITVRARTKSYVLRRIHDHYALILILHPHAAFAVSERALQEAASRISREAGWTMPQGTTRWSCVQVQTEPNDRKRPLLVRVSDAWQPVEVMGALVGLKPTERGFRVRLPSGAEMMLVRERLGRWFADEHIGDIADIGE